MTNLMRWDPFRDLGRHDPLRESRFEPLREIEELTERMNRWLGRTFRRDGGETLALTDWEPVVDVCETDSEYLIKADLPEVRKEDVHVNVQDDMLVIQGERKVEREEKGRRYHRTERAYGRFSRSFTVPSDADTKTISAEYKEGVLNVHVPKLPGTKVKKTEIAIH